MSSGANGKFLFCDGEGCQAKALAPVALNSLLSADPQALSTQGWLFVHENERTLHFCPNCAPRYLDALNNSEYGQKEKDSEASARVPTMLENLKTAYSSI